MHGAREKPARESVRVSSSALNTVSTNDRISSPAMVHTLKIQSQREGMFALLDFIFLVPCSGKKEGVARGGSFYY